MVKPERAEPNPESLLAFTAQVHRALQHWRLLIATAHRPYANLLGLQLANAQPVPPLLPQRLLAICETASAVLEHLPEAASDVIVFLDETLRDGSVYPLLRELRQRPGPPTILLAMSRPLQPALVQAAWREGVNALVCSDDYGTGELARALTALGQGERYCGSSMAALLVGDGRVTSALSRRELDVLPLLAEGLSNRQIAARLQIAEVTARDHVHHILQKLQVGDRTAAAALAVRLGLVR